jgi:aspartate kinase
MAAALDADEVTIWTDVDGVLSADPRLVPSTCSISEISYREAAALARFGAKVLHPKTICPLKPRSIPLCIRNTFAPERPGTKITGAGDGDRNLKALAAIDEIALITLAGTTVTSRPDIIRRALATTRAVRGDAMLVSGTASQGDISLVVPSAAAEQTVDSLRTEFLQEIARQELKEIALDSAVALVTAVGQGVHGRSQIVSRTFDALSRVGVNILAIAQHFRAENLSLVVSKKGVEAALVAIHQEFQLGTLKSNLLPPRASSATAGSNHFGVDCRFNYRDRGPRTLEVTSRENISLMQKLR